MKKTGRFGSNGIPGCAQAGSERLTSSAIADTALWCQSRSLFIRTMTVGPGITPGLLTLQGIQPKLSTFKRSRARRIARHYRRWGIAPRPENVVARLSGGAEFLTYIFRGRMSSFR